MNDLHSRSAVGQRPTRNEAPDRDPFEVALRDLLRELDTSGLERSRIEAELAQMLRDEAEAAGIDTDDTESVGGWMQDSAERFHELAADLQQDLRRDRDAPVVGQPLEQHERTQGKHTMSELVLRLFSGLRADLSVAVRSLRRRPGLTCVVIATLVLGIGLNSAVFSILNSVLLRPPAVEDPASLIKVFSTQPNGFLPEEPMAFPDIVDVGRAESVQATAAQAMTFGALARDGQPSEIIIAEMATDNLFELLGVRPRLGRLFQSNGTGRAAMLGNEGDVALLSAATWKRRFDADPQVIGRVIRLNGHPLEIIGVVPSGYRGLARGMEPEVWVPLETALRVGVSPSTNSGTTTVDSLLDDRNRMSFWAVARLAPGANLQRADAEIRGIAEALQREFPDTNEDRSTTVLAYDQVKVIPAFDGSINTATWVLLGVVFLVLLIAATNLANLFLARGVARRGEIATRLSLGASRSRIVRQLLVESLLLASVGALGGLALAQGTSWLVSRMRIDLMVPLQVSVALDLRVVAFTVAVASFTAIVFGLAPAFEASRTQLLEAMRETSARGGRRLRGQKLLVVAQVAFSVVLLIFAGLALRSIQNAAKIDIGMQTEGVAGLVLSPSSQGYDEAEAAAFYRNLRQELLALPDVSQVSMASHVPLNLSINSSNAVPADRRGEDPDTWPEVDIQNIDETYLEVTGIPILEGRTFTPDERESRARVAVINQTMAEQFWPRGNALDSEFWTEGAEEPRRVIGIVRNGKYRTLGETDRPFAYLPLGTSPSMATVLARFERAGQASPAPVVRVVRKLDPDLAVTGQGTLEEMTSTTLLIPRLAVAVFGFLGLVGLLISSIGLFGVLAYSVSQRTHEIGLRVAIGASRASVVALVARRSLLLTAMGIAVGVGVAFASTRFLEAMLYGVSATDVWSFAGGVGVLLLAALVASLVPARSALRISPTEALRYE